MADDQDITPAILLRHMQGMEQRMLQKIEQVRAELLTGIQTLRKDTQESLEVLRRQISLLSTQIGNMDPRLDEMEIVLLPRRVAVREEAVGIGGKAER